MEHQSKKDDQQTSLKKVVKEVRGGLVIKKITTDK